jgi:NADPH:quinone reductase-like Zn-dependent oxidoreductase
VSGEPDRFGLSSAGAAMQAVVTTGTGGYDRLVLRAVPVPAPGPGDVLIQVLAAGVNNTDINTRLGWYSPSVEGGTADAAAAAAEARDRADGGWSGRTPFPLIQGTDCCGRVVRAASTADAALVGRRVLVRPCMRPHGFASPDTVWLGSDVDGAFAQFVKVPASEVFPIDCDWTDAELASLPCAYGTAENMLERAGLGAGEHVLISGASGGVGSAALQLALRRGATVTAIAAGAKHPALQALGAARLLDRDEDPATLLGTGSVDLVVDNVAGPGFERLLGTLRRGGRYVSSGAIGGPIVRLDMRELYLRDLTLIGCTAWAAPVFPNLIGYVERGEIRPLIAGIFPLERIVEAQREFLLKAHVGNFVLVPPAP